MMESLPRPNARSATKKMMAATIQSSRGTALIRSQISCKIGTVPVYLDSGRFPALPTTYNLIQNGNKKGSGFRKKPNRFQAKILGREALCGRAGAERKHHYPPERHEVYGGQERARRQGPYAVCDSRRRRCREKHPQKPF